jgi:hypothetical protein
MSLQGLGTQGVEDKVELRLRTPCPAVISKSSIAPVGRLELHTIDSRGE